MIRAILLLLLLPSICVAPFITKESHRFLLAGGGHLPDIVKDNFITLAGGKQARIIIIPSASILPDAGQSYLDYFKSRVLSSEILHTTDRNIANDPAFSSKLKNATGVWVSGGNQLTLLSIYRGTLVAQELKQLIARKGIIGGTSAGASCVSDIMIYQDTENVGFSFWPKVIVDQHFNTRHRLQRLRKLLLKHPDCVGIGLDEGTAIYSNGDDCTVIGNGNVSVCNPNGQIQVYAKNNNFSMKH